ncbi:MYXO-CTERM sorting domain-containing protein [Lamprobacter modestohalophilus]|uniref:MYXO-CTERM sorting domain-containing protein n=1 Tax=Lamprobacter modestohalophilus TaxID=1064514 RepID=UPI003D1893DD
MDTRSSGSQAVDCRSTGATAASGPAVLFGALLVGVLLEQFRRRNLSPTAAIKQGCFGAPGRLMLSAPMTSPQSQTGSSASRPAV